MVDAGVEADDQARLGAGEDDAAIIGLISVGQDRVAHGNRRRRFIADHGV